MLFFLLNSAYFQLQIELFVTDLLLCEERAALLPLQT